MHVASGDITLSGTLVIPENPCGVVVFVHGSGPQDRNQNSGFAKLNTFAVLSEAITGAGFASLRWDKRGVGASGGDYATAGQGDLVADVIAMIGFAREQGVGPVICCGHSEGTQLAPQAAQTAPVDGHILICPYITSGREILMQQVARHDTGLAQLGGWVGVYMRFVARILGTPSQQQTRFLNRLAKSKGDTVRLGFKKVPARWLRDFITADTVALHATNIAPSLVLSAAFDAQCPPEDGAKIAGLNPQAKHVLLDGLSHLLRQTDAFDFADYPRQLGVPQDPRVAKEIVTWLGDVFPDCNLS